MKLKQESRALKQKALDSLIFTIEAFNSPHEAGRATRVLLHLQHAFEMLLKAALVQTKDKRVFDSATGRSIGFERCVRLAAENNIIKLGESDAGTLRAIDAMRDDEQHWFNIVSEQLLYLHARAGVTLFDELLQRVFSEHLADRLPGRVLPISVDPPRELAMVLDDEYSQITALLQPHRRAGHEARARLRTLLAMEAHLEPDTRVSDKDVTRVERGIRDGKGRDEVFPRLEDVATAIDGDGVQVVVHFTKKQGARGAGARSLAAPRSSPEVGIVTIHRASGLRARRTAPHSRGQLQIWSRCQNPRARGDARAGAFRGSCGRPGGSSTRWPSPAWG